MRRLFSAEGLHALRAAIVPTPLCLFDFDGTLTPLLPDPDAVLLPPPVQDQLRLLQRRAPVGIITGRALADLRPRLGFEPDHLVGNHGLEGLPGRPPPVTWAQLVAQWKVQLLQHTAAIDPAVWVEDKHYSLSLHYLNARDVGQAEPALRAVLASLVPAPRIIPGKSLFSVLPSGAGDKGSAVLALLAQGGHARALYVGDDVTDEDVFRLDHPGLFTIRVGREVASAARWRLDDTDEVAHLLDWLVKALPERGAR